MSELLSLATVENDIILLTPLVPKDIVLQAMERVHFLKKEAKRLDDLFEQFAIEWIRSNGDLVVNDTVRYYVGATKTTKCVDVPETIKALLNATDGDFGKLCETLSSGCIKHGAAKKILSEEDFTKLFITSSSDNLEEGKPDKKLKKIDTKFVK